MAIDNEIEDKEAAMAKEDADELPKVSVTTHLRLRVCCEDNANAVKAKLAAIKGVEQVRVDYTLNKVTISSSRPVLEDVVAAVARVEGAAVELWQEDAMNKRERSKVAVHEPQQGQIFVTTTSDCYERWRWRESNAATS